MHYFTWTLESVSNILWIVAAIQDKDFTSLLNFQFFLNFNFPFLKYIPKTFPKKGVFNNALQEENAYK